MEVNIIHLDKEKVQSAIKRGKELADIESLVYSDPVPSAYCQSRIKDMSRYIDEKPPKVAFFALVDELDNGCESCNMCESYGRQKHCPVAQRHIASFYRDGSFVPLDLKISHQWERLASRQGYKHASIQVADDMAVGRGCEQDISKAIEIYDYYASRGDQGCIDSMMRLVESTDERSIITILPYIVMKAMNGDEQSLMFLVEGFHSGFHGLPRDKKQEREWILKGAELNSPVFMKRVAELHEASNEWDTAYKWYNELFHNHPKMVSEEKLQDIVFKMLTYDKSIEKISTDGINYLYGHYGFDFNPQYAKICLEYASSKGNMVAIGQLGMMYYEGIGAESQIHRGLRLINVAANSGDLRILSWLVNCSLEEDNDFTDGYFWEEALDKGIAKLVGDGDPYAIYLKGHYMKLGHIFSQDVYSAFNLLLDAAQKDVVEAQYEVALMYRDGIGTEINTSEYRIWLDKACINGHFKAEGIRGVEIYKSGWIWDKSKAFNLLKSSIKKGNDDDEVRWQYARMAYKGQGNSDDKAHSMSIYIKAATHGKLEAQEQLCKDYYYGTDYVSQSYDESSKWGEAAIKNGSTNSDVRFKTAYSSSKIGKKDLAREIYQGLVNEGDTTSMNNLACLTSDSTKAFELFLRAANKNEAVAQYNVARYYRDGIGTVRDESKAVEYYTKSANNGYLSSIVELANLYKVGDCGLEQDSEAAISWFEKAVNAGNDNYLLDIGVIYMMGGTISPDGKKAVHYFKLAVEKGCKKGFALLAKIYEEGLIVDRDLHKAEYWRKKAKEEKE